MEFNELGKYIDELYTLRQKRLSMQKEVDEVKAQETAMRLEILDTLGESGLAKASGMTATASLTVAIQPMVMDWEKVYDFIKTNNRFELLQKRIGVEAWRELYKDGFTVPGTEANEVLDVSLTKSTR